MHVRVAAGLALLRLDEERYGERVAPERGVLGAQRRLQRLGRRPVDRRRRCPRHPRHPLTPTRRVGRAAGRHRGDQPHPAAASALSATCPADSPPRRPTGAARPGWPRPRGGGGGAARRSPSTPPAGPPRPPARRRVPCARPAAGRRRPARSGVAAITAAASAASARAASASATSGSGACACAVPGAERTPPAAARAAPRRAAPRRVILGPTCPVIRTSAPARGRPSCQWPLRAGIGGARPTEPNAGRDTLTDPPLPRPAGASAMPPSALCARRQGRCRGSCTACWSRSSQPPVSSWTSWTCAPPGRRHTVKVVVDSDTGVGLDDIAEALPRRLRRARPPRAPHRRLVHARGHLARRRPPAHRASGTGGGRACAWSPCAPARASRSPGGSARPARTRSPCWSTARCGSVRYADVERAAVEVEFKPAPETELALLARDATGRGCRVNVDIAALRAIERDKDIPFETVLEAIETALLTAYRHTDGHQPHARIDIDRKTGAVRVHGPGARPRRARSPASGTTPPRASAGSPPPPPGRSSCSACATPSTSARSASSPAKEGEIVAGVIQRDARANARGVVVVALSGPDRGRAAAGRAGARRELRARRADPLLRRRRHRGECGARRSR